MENQKDKSGMLELMTQPALCVENGIICYLNHPARQLLLEVGMPVSTLLGADAQEYAQFRNGCLYLTMEIMEQKLGARVTRLDTFDLFLIEQNRDQADLRAMALTAAEFREPLSAIQAVVAQLRASIADSDATTQTQFAQMNQRLFQMQRMVCNMSDAARYAAEVLSRMSHQNICSVVAEVFEHAQMLLEHCGIRLCYTVPHESIICTIDKEKLERAVYNMLSNAARAMKSGGIIDARLTRRNQTLYLSVRDYGDSIPDSALTQVFCRFQRQPGLEGCDCGIGLGMVLIRQAATTHGGTVLVTRPDDGGTCVTMSIPIRQNRATELRSLPFLFDYAGERDHGLLELSDVLPVELYR